MSTKQKVLKLIKEMKCTYEDNGWDFLVDTPKGKLFYVNHCHTLVHPYANHGQTWKTKMWPELLNELKCGMFDCEIKDCDVCEEK